VVVLRATRKVLAHLSPAPDTGAVSDTALGDWYVTLVDIDDRPLLLLVSSRSLLSILIQARDIAALPQRLPGLVATRLRRLGIAQPLIDAEVAAMSPVCVAPTLDRSVVGSMVEFGKSLNLWMPLGWWDKTSLPFVEVHLSETPCRVTGRLDDILFPKRAAPKLLAARWQAA
jgi:uncharacterized protein DUF6933